MSDPLRKKLYEVCRNSEKSYATVRMASLMHFLTPEIRWASWVGLKESLMRVDPQVVGLIKCLNVFMSVDIHCEG